ncbi:MAG: hypothetical protein ACI9N9_000695 [Enterobacterales bacterium]|jgi:hypothetical protein
MSKSIFVMLIVLASAMSLNVAAADNTTAKLSPMVLIELGADMKADWVYSERMLTIEIKNELEATHRTSIINRDFLRVQRTKSVLAFTKTTVFVLNTERLKTAE